MVMVVGQHEGLVEVKPPLRERTQQWARLAGQAVSFEDINLVHTAFLAVWWEAAAAKSFETVVQHVTHDKMHFAISWLGRVIDELDVALQTWQRVLDALAALSVDRTLARRLGRYAMDTSTHFNEVAQRLAAVQVQTEVFCEMYGVPLPERLFQVSSGAADVVGVEN